MTVSIRPHHLLCMLTFLGKGYTPQFVVNYGKIIRRLNAGEALEIVEGADDICAPMLGEADCHCHNDNILERDRLTALEVGEILGKVPESGDQLEVTADVLRKLREAFAAGTIRSACKGCEWFDLCTEIAENKFSGCRLASR